MDRQTQKALVRLVKAAREWYPTNLTRTGAGTKGRLEAATAEVEALGLERVMEELTQPAPPAFVALHGQALEDWLEWMVGLWTGSTQVFVMEVKVDQEGLKVRINHDTEWSPGLGEPRGSQ